MPLHVLIAGGGIGGLALAQGLRKAGVGVAVYERDPSPDFRPQGYRIHLDAAGHTSLAECLSEDLYELYVATSTRTPKSQLAVFFDHQLNEIRVADARVGDCDPARAPTAVNRLTLRQILLAGLDGVVHFGRELVSYQQDDNGVQAQFADGSAATGDVLVAADGITSVIRSQLLAHAEVHDTGVRAINGKTPLEALGAGLPERLDNSFTGVHGPDFRTLAMAVYRSRRPHAEAADDLIPGMALDPVPDYLMWLQLARAEDYPIAEEELWKADPATLHRLALDMLDGWHPDLRGLVECADQPETFPLAIRAVLPVPEWPTTNITLLGDAIHAMTPIGGLGGNTALRDAALLARQLTAVDRGERELQAAIAEYETQMRDYGYTAVVDSLRNAAPSLGARSPYGAARASAPS